jgi:hypothetical protein
MGNPLIYENGKALSEESVIDNPTGIIDVALSSNTDDKRKFRVLVLVIDILVKYNHIDMYAKAIILTYEKYNQYYMKVANEIELPHIPGIKDVLENYDKRVAHVIVSEVVAAFPKEEVGVYVENVRQIVSSIDGIFQNNDAEVHHNYWQDTQTRYIKAKVLEIRNLLELKQETNRDKELIKHIKSDLLQNEERIKYLERSISAVNQKETDEVDIYPSIQLPLEAPKLYTDYLQECEDTGVKSRQRMNPWEFTQEYYRIYLDAEILFQEDLRCLDPDLVSRFSSWAYRQKKKASDYILVESDRVDRELEALPEEKIRECHRIVEAMRRRRLKKGSA